MKTFRKAALASAAVLAASLGFAPSSQAQSSGNLTFAPFATHPLASVQGSNDPNGCSATPETDPNTGTAFCPIGRAILDMQIDSSGTLVAGYGDWGWNADSWGRVRVAVVPLNVNTGTWGQAFNTGSESLDVVRKINDKFYLPMTDPSWNAPSDRTGSISGVITNRNGAWQSIADGIGMTHVFDVASTGNDLWLFGAGPDSAGNTQRSTDGGDTWKTVHKATNASPTGWERTYWGVAVNGKVYSSSRGMGGGDMVRSSTDGASWSTTKVSAQHIDQRIYESFAGSLIMRNPFGTLVSFDTKSSKTTDLIPASMMKDLYVDGSNLYALDGSLRRTDASKRTWTTIASGLPSDARSVAVHNGYVYLGMGNGTIMRSTTTISGAAPVVDTSPKVTGSSPTTLKIDGNVQTVTLNGTNLDKAVSVRALLMKTDGVQSFVDAPIVTKGATALKVTVNTSGARPKSGKKDTTKAVFYVKDATGKEFTYSMPLS